jgi:hypothetical protein
MTLYGKAHNQPYLGIQNLEPNPELNTIAKAKNTFTYSSIEEFPIESLEAFDSSMLLGKDFSPMRSSSLHLKIGDNANFTSRRENLNTNYNLSVNDTTTDYAGGTTSEIGCLPDDFTSEDFENLVSYLDQALDN